MEDIMRKVFFFACFCFVMSACSVVTSIAPVGETPAVVDPKEWDGNWMNTDGATISIKVKSEKEGLLGIAWIEDDTHMTCKSADIFIRSSGSWRFASMKDKDTTPADQPKYLWGRIKNEKNLILFWLPTVSKFRELVESKVFSGEASKGGVLLRDLTPGQMKIMISEEKGVLFDWDSPVIFMRTTR